MARLRMALIGNGPGSFMGPVARLTPIPRGMALIETAVQASARGAGWVEFRV